MQSNIGKHKSVSYAKYGYIFSIPFIVIYLIFQLYPLLYTLIIGFTDLKGVGKTDFEFLPNLFDNFKGIIQSPVFKTSLVNTVIIWMANFIPQMLLALALTAWFNSRHYRVRGQGIFKVIFYMPNIITAATVAILFFALFAYPIGPVNHLLKQFGISESGVNFIQNTTASPAIVAFIQFWQWYGYTMLVLTSGVLGLNPELFEAAEIDGASDFQTFFRVTLPNIRTIMIYTLITSLIGGLSMFDIPRLFNNGGPDNSTLTVTLFIYNQAFAGSYMYNRAAAASVLLFIVIAVLSAIVFFLMRDSDEAKLKKAERARRKANKAKGGAWA
jgi:multiple sugar transport system permease protein